jgi:hypothetical protein
LRGADDLGSRIACIQTLSVTNSEQNWDALMHH